VHHAALSDQMPSRTAAASSATVAGRELDILLRHRRARMAEELLHLEQPHAALDEPRGVDVTGSCASSPAVALDEIRRVEAGPSDCLADRMGAKAPGKCPGNYGDGLLKARKPGLPGARGQLGASELGLKIAALGPWR
jgi:hypothetical protein